MVSDKKELTDSSKEFKLIITNKTKNPTSLEQYELDIKLEETGNSYLFYKGNEAIKQRLQNIKKSMYSFTSQKASKAA